MSDLTRSADLAKIHIAKKDLDMNDEDYRNLLWSIARQRSAAKLDFSARKKVLEYFKKIGWKAKHLSPKSNVFPTQADKAVALWIDMHKTGIVNDGSEGALNHYVEKLTGLSSVRFLNQDPRAANKVIESLKKWQARYEQ